MARAGIGYGEALYTVSANFSKVRQVNQYQGWLPELAVAGEAKFCIIDDMNYCDDCGEGVCGEDCDSTLSIGPP